MFYSWRSVGIPIVNTCKECFVKFLDRDHSVDRDPDPGTLEM